MLANDHPESARHLARLESLEPVGVVPDEYARGAPTVRTGELPPPHLRQKSTALDRYVFWDRR